MQNKNMQKIRKAVIPAAGFGTRFLPMTKASPKEMLPVVDKPVIQYIVEEAVSAGIEEIIIITGSNKRPIEDHFDYNFELEYRLKQAGKKTRYKEIRAISDMAKFVYIRQKEALGNGHAVLCAKEVVNHEPFLVLWGDEILLSKPNRVEQLMKTYNILRHPILTGIKRSDVEDRKKYAFISGKEVKAGLWKVDNIVEKPEKTQGLSDVAIIGGYVFPPEIFKYLEAIKPSRGGEIWLSDAIEAYKKDYPVYAQEIKNFEYFDCGSKEGYLKANIIMALKDKKMRPVLQEIFSREKIK